MDLKSDQSNRDSHRFINVPGSLNLRDFGDYATQEGGKVVPGRLFRCGSLGYIPEDSFEQFRALGVTTICDLRRVDEAADSPTPGLISADAIIHIPIAPGSSEMLRASFSDPNTTAEDRVVYMTDITREIARDHHEDYALLMNALLACEGGFLLHCSAGKDRTGFGAALILTALGVDEKTIVEDYLLTNLAGELFAFMGPRMAERYGHAIDHDSIMAVGGVREEYLGAALDEVKKNHGDLTGYLDAIGIDKSARRQLREKFVS